MNMNTAEKLFSSSLNLVTLDVAAIKEAKTCFAEYQRIGVIKDNCGFDNGVWYTTDEYANIGLHYTFNDFSYQSYEHVLGLTLEDFVLCVKAFLISLLGRNALSCTIPVWWNCVNENDHLYVMSPKRRLLFQKRHREPCPYCKGRRRKKRHFV